MKLDEKDFKILDMLKYNSKASIREIAKKTLLPITTIHNRVKNFNKFNIIKKYTIELNHKILGFDFSTYLLINVNLPRLKELKKSQYDIVKELKKVAEIETVNIVSGGTDIVAFIRCKNTTEYDEILFNKIQTIDGIDNTRSLIVIHES